jgi:DNA-binding response OmpR family regulator
MTSEIGVVSEQSVLPGAVRVLVVDDDVAICNQLAAGLATAGFQVVTAHDAAGALAQAAQTPPDVAIVDLGMPGVSGFDVIRHLKTQQGVAVHVIVLTGQDDEPSRAEAFDAGTDDYVLKPIGLAEIRRRVTAAIRNQRAYVQVRLEKEAAERRLVYGQEASALLAHDLNNGLSVSLSNLSYLLETVHGDADTTDALAATLRSVRRMSGLVANFVDIARFEDAAVKPMVNKANLGSLLRSILEVNASSIKKGVVYEIDCADDIEGRFDIGLIERVLHNLVGNAMRYCTAPGKIVLRGRRWLPTEQSSVEIGVMNTGPQIPENIRGNLFGKYVQGKGGKRGMGLYFCRLVADAHGGRIDCEPHHDGPSFMLRLPGRA